jgi:hypothetical protein
MRKGAGIALSQSTCFSVSRVFQLSLDLQSVAKICTEFAMTTRKSVAPSQVTAEIVFARRMMLRT